MYHLDLDKPGGPSRPRHQSQPQYRVSDDNQFRRRRESGASRSSRVESTSTRSEMTAKVEQVKPDRGKSWGQTIYDVGIYGSALGIAYRLLRPAQDLQVDSHERHPDALPMPTTRRVRNTSLTDLVNQESGSEVSLEAALGEALADSISTLTTDPPADPPAPERESEFESGPGTPLRPQPLAQWSFNINSNSPSRRRRNDPSRLSRVSYISTLSTQSSTLSSIDSDWTRHRDVDCESAFSPESLYILTPPAPRVTLPIEQSHTLKQSIKPISPIRLVGLGIQFDGEEEESESVEEDSFVALDKLDVLLAKVVQLTAKGLEALSQGPTRIHAGLPVSSSGSRRKLHTSLD